MKNKTSKLKKASLGDALGKALPQVEKYAPMAGKLVQGIQMLKDEKTELERARQMKGVSNVALQASMTQPEQVQRRYLRPEDNTNTGEEFFPIYGVGTNPLAKHGKTIKGKKAAGGINLKGFENLGGEDMVERLMTGIGGENGGGMVGGSIGRAAGKLTGIPGAGLVGQAIGQGIGALIDRKPKKIKDNREATMANINQMGMIQGTQGLQQHNASYMRTGGSIRENKMERQGELQVYRGEAEPISHNPYLPDGGETVMFKGPSHEDDGMPIKYGNTPIEVEGGEPAVKLQDGGGADNLVVFGNMKIPNDFASMLGDDKAKGKKFKNYIHDISKTEAKQNKLMDKSIESVNSLDPNSSFDKLTMNSQIANLRGADMRLKDAAKKKMMLASLQSAMNRAKDKDAKAADGIEAKAWSDDFKVDTTGMKKPGTINDALEYYKRDAPAWGEDFKVDMTGIPEKNLGTLQDMLANFKSKPITYSDAATGDQSSKKDLSKAAMTIGNEILPYVRPSDAQDLDTRQLMGEMYALSTNQVQPVQAQKFTPQLSTPYDISFQDQLNRGVADFRGAQKLMGYNPAAQSMLAAQKYEQDQQVLGEQFRANQAMRDQTYGQNRNALNESNLQNLGILDQQYQRQAQALSTTKGTTQAALNSISSKELQNQLENRTLQAYENEYAYRYDKRGRAINMNQLFNPNIPQIVDGKVPVVDNDGNIVAYQYVADSANSNKKTETKPAASGRNGAILKAARKL